MRADSGRGRCRIEDGAEGLRGWPEGVGRLRRIRGGLGLGGLGRMDRAVVRVRWAALVASGSALG